MLELTPRGNRVLCEFEAFKMAGGLYVPGQDGKPTDKKMGRWIVRKLGEGKLLDNGTLVPVPFAIGDTVLIHPHSGPRTVGVSDKMLFGDKDQCIVNVEDIIATTEGEPDLVTGKIRPATAKERELVH